MVEKNLAEAFNDCVDRLIAGQSVEDCARIYPQYAGELRDLLETGIAVQHARPAVPLAVRARVRARVMPRRTGFRPTHLMWAAAAAAVVLVVISYLRSTNDQRLQTLPLSTATPSPTVTATATAASTATPTATTTETTTVTATATTRPATTAPSCIFVVEYSSINLRSGPGTGYTVVGYAYAGDEYRVLAVHTSGLWYNVATAQGDAWLASSVGTLQGACDALPVSDQPFKDSSGPLPSAVATNTSEATSDDSSNTDDNSGSNDDGGGDDNNSSSSDDNSSSSDDHSDDSHDDNSGSDDDNHSDDEHD